MGGAAAEFVPAAAVEAEVGVGQVVEGCVEGHCCFLFFSVV